jgi:hypothetical protein
VRHEAIPQTAASRRGSLFPYTRTVYRCKGGRLAADHCDGPFSHYPAPNTRVSGRCSRRPGSDWCPRGRHVHPGHAQACSASASASDRDSKGACTCSDHHPRCGSEAAADSDRHRTRSVRAVRRIGMGRGGRCRHGSWRSRRAGSRHRGHRRLPAPQARGCTPSASHKHSLPVAAAPVARERHRLVRHGREALHEAVPHESARAPLTSTGRLARSPAWTRPAPSAAEARNPCSSPGVMLLSALTDLRGRRAGRRRC